VRPFGPRLAVLRSSGERVLPWGLVLPAPDLRDSRVGTVVAIGEPHKVGSRKLPLDVEPGALVWYSSRVDTFKTTEGEVDIVDENSVIGILQ
jgi:co-chaperonin GroES (HSP10)